jgi:hypothetical protein
MGLRDWLYGPLLTEEESGTSFLIAPLTINKDDLRDFDTKMDQLFAPSPVHRFATSLAQEHGDEFTSLDDLLKRPAYDRRQLIYDSNVPDDLGTLVTFQLWDFNTSRVALSGPSDEAVALARELVETMAHGARRRLRLPLVDAVLRILAFLPIAALYGVAVWLLWSWRAVPLFVLVGLVVGYVAHKLTNRMLAPAFSWARVRQGTVLETVSRTEVEERRRNARRDVRVALWTGLILAPLGGLIGTLITLAVT